jgi:hypothetical protein
VIEDPPDSAVGLEGFPAFEEHVAHTTDVQTSPEGILQPALVIGLGECGELVLRQLRRQIQETFGALDPLPNVRFLCLDTDGQALAQATQGGDDALRPAEIVHTKLHRAPHYLKVREFDKAIASWLPQKILYRIPRQQTTTGLRALGRLAYVDHFPQLRRRIQAEIDVLASGEPLLQAAHLTGMEVASTVPRVYVVANLAGGTGGGRFLDLAFLVRSLLRRKGISQAPVIGLFLLPQQGRSPQRIPGLANAYAALTELNHFGH